jgi:hypothetical protein
MTIDISRPHIGRIYDYVLGGTYNHEVDRKAAKAMMEIIPAYPQWARQNRAFLGHVGQRWAKEGRRYVLDLGSGLPTQGHFNTHMPDAKILFADSDPLSVLQGQQLLAYTSDMAYCEVDLRQADAVIRETTAYFGDERHVSVGCIGVAYFLSDEAMTALMQRLHAFCAPDSALALSWPVMPDTPEVRASIASLSKHARIDFFNRRVERVAELIAPWRVVETHRLVDLFGEDTAPVANPEHPFNQAEIFGVFAAH